MLLYYAIENTANQNAGKPLHIFKYYTKASRHASRYVALIVLTTVFTVAWYRIVMQRSLVVYLKVNTLSEWIIGIYLHSFINNGREFSVSYEAASYGIENFDDDDDNDVKEVVSSQPSVTRYKLSNQKIGTH